MKILKGLPVSPGIAIGKSLVLEPTETIIYKKNILPREVPTEIKRFKDALTITKEEMKKVRQKILQQLGRGHGKIFDAYLLILEDPKLYQETVEIIANQRVNAEFAFDTAIKNILKAFSLIEDNYIRDRSRDVQDIATRVIANLTGKKKRELEEISSPVIIVAHNLTPSDTISFRRGNVLAFVTDMGGQTSHAAIIAKSLEIPAVVGLKEITRAVKTRDTLIVDGDEGTVIILPDKQTIKKYQEQQKKYFVLEKELESLRSLPAITKDGKKIKIVANIESPEETSSAISHGAEGIGLYRTEYLYLNREDLPSEEEQFQSYKKTVEKMNPLPVIIRTFDLGGDKLAAQLKLDEERNPFMGLRAIRLGLKFPYLLKTQLRAILRASVYGNLKIMYPMISGVEELRKVNNILLECKKELQKQGIKFAENIPVGVLIEVPSAALTADIIAREADFLSIGTNDLIQYSLAVDRINENVAHLYEPLHLSILRLIKNVVDAGHRFKKLVGICGEMAADPTFTSILVGLDIDELSMSPFSIPKIKKIIRSLKYIEAKELCEQVLESNEPQEIFKIIKKAGD